LKPAAAWKTSYGEPMVDQERHESGAVSGEDGQGPDDMELVALALGGQWEAFETLVSRFESRVFGLTRRILQQREDAEDATQQTFLSVMENLDRFRGESSFATWVLRIATNHALKILRKRQRRRTVPLDLQGGPDGGDGELPHPDYIAQWSDDPADLAQRAEVQQLLNEALDELDEKYRLVFLVRDVQGFSTREAAEMLEITESNVKVRLLRARLQLRERLTRVLGDESTRIVPDHEHHQSE
jgi:RNA polymerase sigma-70 factor (ECF subfamily)